MWIQKIKEAIITSQTSTSLGSLANALDTAENGWANLIEIFHRMVPPNLFLAASEGQLLGLICFGLLLDFFRKIREDLRQSQLRVLARSTGDYSQTYPFYSWVCPNWYFWPSHPNNCKKWTGHFLANGGVCFNCIFSTRSTCTPYPAHITQSSWRYSS